MVIPAWTERGFFFCLYAVVPSEIESNFIYIIRWWFSISIMTKMSRMKIPMNNFYERRFQENKSNWIYAITELTYNRQLRKELIQILKHCDRIKVVFPHLFILSFNNFQLSLSDEKNSALAQNRHDWHENSVRMRDKLFRNSERLNYFLFSLSF